MRYIVILLAFLTTSPAWTQDLTWKPIETNTAASFRSLSIPTNDIAWVGGTQGWVGRSTNGGQTWDFKQVAGFDKVDFRSLYAFNDQRAIVANAGSPAHILVTTDGGSTWKTVYQNDHPDAFFDGIDFWNDKEGIIYGDPIKGKMLMLKTTDGGLTWQEVNTAPSLNEGEASFAASGTGIRCMDKKILLIATGGKTSRLFRSPDKGATWTTLTPPVIQGQGATGIFSVAFKNKKEGIVVGGDYQRDSLRTNHVFYTKDAGKTWLAPTAPTRGYREVVEYLDSKLVLSAGPGGVDISKDGGITWAMFSDEKGFHVVRKARSGTRILIAGSKGRVVVVR